MTVCSFRLKPETELSHTGSDERALPCLVCLAKAKWQLQDLFDENDSRAQHPRKCTRWVVYDRLFKAVFVKVRRRGFYPFTLPPENLKV